MSKRKDVGQETIESAVPDAEAAAATEAQAKSATASTPTIDAATAPPAKTEIKTGIGAAVRGFSRAAIKPLATHRFALLAASVAIAAALGALIGSLGTRGPAALSAPAAATNASRNLQVALTQMSKEVAALKASIEASNRAATAQASKISERFDRSERAQAEPAAKIAALSNTVARLEQRIAANASQEITGSVPDRAAAKEPAKPAIVEGWVLRDIYRGRALVENRSGLYEIAPGADLPGIGRVETITRQNGRWVVVTPKGLIVSMR